MGEMMQARILSDGKEYRVQFRDKTLWFWGKWKDVVQGYGVGRGWGRRYFPSYESASQHIEMVTTPAPDWVVERATSAEPLIQREGCPFENEMYCRIRLECCREYRRHECQNMSDI